MNEHDAYLTRQEIDRCYRLLSDKDVELVQLHHVIEEAVQARKRIDDENRALRNELRSLQQRHDDATALSDTRGKELAGAQVFLSTADSISVSNVISEVESLNEEIFQAAATLAETVTHHDYRLSHEDWLSKCGSVRRIMGEATLNLLLDEERKRRREINPLLVQVIVQIMLVEVCRDLIRDWDPHDRVRHKTIVDLYESIHSSEPQPIAGRWRALTRAHTPISFDRWQTDAMSDFNKIIQVSQWRFATDHYSTFQKSLQQIFKATQHLRRSIGEKITSVDLVAYRVPAEAKFDKKLMEIAYGDDGRPKNNGGRSVLGTTALGLQKCVDATSGTLVMMPKVVIESGLREDLDSTDGRGSSRRTYRYEAQDGSDR